MITRIVVRVEHPERGPNRDVSTFVYTDNGGDQDYGPTNGLPTDADVIEYCRFFVEAIFNESFDPSIVEFIPDWEMEDENGELKKFLTKVNQEG